jgi:ribonuclease P protein component|tara:strand:+ start:1690 stop:2058 length:369 start_codon:yes stop_codon:yes gene_type:complete
MRLTLSKEEKLKSRKLIEKLFIEGDSLKEYPLRLKYLKIRDENNSVKVAFSVPKRNFKLAVDRNRIKRLLRESYRKNKVVFVEGLIGEYILMFMYTDSIEWSQVDLDKKILRLMNKFVKSEK